MILFVVALISMYVLDAVPFKILFSLFALVAAIELFSFFKKRHDILAFFLVILEFIFIICCVVFVLQKGLYDYWYIIFGVPSYDIFAYLCGSMIGGKIFKNSRPFPKISKNKTWEGTICGLVASFLLVLLLVCSRNAFSSGWVYFLCGPLALLGDLFESFLKRRFNIKDSNEIVIKNKFFSKIELLIGGADGHGGFLDRIDSVSFTTTVVLLITFMV